MSENKLPEGVGKKIVEALKKQSEIEVTAMPEFSDETEMENLITDEVEEMFADEELALNEKQEQTDFSYQAPPVTPQYNEPVYQQPYEQDIPYVMAQQYREPQPTMNYTYMENSYSEQPQTVVFWKKSGYICADGTLDCNGRRV